MLLLIWSGYGNRMLIILDLHKFMVAISRIEVNHDGFGGTAPDAMVWDKGGVVKTRTPSFRLIVDHATLPGPPGFLSSTWCTLYPLPITPDDVAVWPYSVDILLVFSSFLASLHWPQGASDLGKFGNSYLELLLMFEVFAGHRLLLRKLFAPNNVPVDPWFFLVFQLVLGKRSDRAVNFLIAFSGLWVISREVLLGLFLVNLVLILLDCRI